MICYSTKRQSPEVSFKEALLTGLPPDNGLYMPSHIPKMDGSFFAMMKEMPFQDIAFHVASEFLHDEISDGDLEAIIHDAINFEAPVIHLRNNLHILELFHGPTLAFKDFGARFMARTMAHFLKEEKRELTILVATSGDTGGAVAAGFYKTEGINVVILYPSGKVSDLQERQLTTLGENIVALEIDGNFDDCQRMVKSAFLDQEISQKLNLASANSINLGRLLPQSFYYFNAWAQMECYDPLVFCIPSGNFGNLTAGLIAKRMGLPASKFIAATNANRVVPEYLASGNYEPVDSVSTISNAMDVGNPSNFARMLELFQNDHNEMSKEISGFCYSDDETRSEISKTFKNEGYLLDPHGAVGTLAAEQFVTASRSNESVIILETAHPSKFKAEVEKVTGTEIEVPERLVRLRQKEKRSIKMTSAFEDLKSWFIDSN